MVRDAPMVTGQPGRAAQIRHQTEPGLGQRPDAVRAHEPEIAGQGQFHGHTEHPPVHGADNRNLNGLQAIEIMLEPADVRPDGCAAGSRIHHEASHQAAQ